MKPLLTVFTPSFNRADCLRHCYESLRRQTCRDFIWLVVDDGSTDGSGAIADAYAARYPERFRVFHKENGGQASARNPVSYTHLSQAARPYS